MRHTPEATGTIHFTGIGGIGMSGIAEILAARGYHVQGSDLSENANVLRLKSKGICVFTGEQEAKNLKNASVIVVSSAIQPNNPELLEAQRKGIPIVHRSEMLAEIMRLNRSIAISGSHGKTTTTSLMAHIMDTANYDPTIINGGIIHALGSNARAGTGDWLVAEADESDGSVVKLPATVGVITNIDPEHLDHYGSLDGVRQTFRIFVENLPFYGLGVLNADHPETRALSQQIYKRRILTYGTSEDADVRIEGIQLTPTHSDFIVVFSEKAKSLLELNNTQSSFRLSMVGAHNVSNAVAAIVVALHIGISIETIQSALSSFTGVGRRFTLLGNANNLMFVDDYAHHPVEVTKTLEAARLTTKGKVIAIFQPHRYSRLHSLMDEFATSLALADEVCITPVYSAGESPIPYAEAEDLANKITQTPTCVLNSPAEVIEYLSHVNQEAIVIFMGAGSITHWAHECFEYLAQSQFCKIASQ